MNITKQLSKIRYQGNNQINNSNYETFIIFLGNIINFKITFYIKLNKIK